jgi:hypothetical protein
MSQMERIKSAFTNMNARNVEILDQFYDEKIHFQDPLGVHKGRDSVKSYYANIYKNVTFIEFEYTNTISEGNKHLLVWTMNLKAKGLNSGELVSLAGNSVIIFNEKNLVSYHRDYFDIGEFIYEYIPILGWVIKKIKKKLGK